jgi:predicted nucleic acid-binding protein
VLSILVDANLLIAGFLRTGHPLLAAARRGRVELAVCPHVLREAQRMVTRAFPRREAEWRQYMAELPARHVADASEAAVADWREYVSDPEDGAVLAAAIEAGLDGIVTSDRTFIDDARATLALADDPLCVYNVPQLLAVIGWRTLRHDTYWPD